MGLVTTDSALERDHDASATPVVGMEQGETRLGDDTGELWLVAKRSSLPPAWVCDPANLRCNQFVQIKNWAQVQSVCN